VQRKRRSGRRDLKHRRISLLHAQDKTWAEIAQLRQPIGEGF
jgi:hypothetical protein